MKWPDLCLQNVVPGEWWERTTSTELQPGHLVHVILPHVDLVPYRLWVDERYASRVHDKFEGRIEQTSVREARGSRTLPVAGLPEQVGETYTVHRSKRRPALVVAGPGTVLGGDLTRGKHGWQTARTLLVAPFYGVEAKAEKRLGWHEPLVNRIMTVEYPQYHWDVLPTGDEPKGSILRLDHLQPVGAHQRSYEPSGWRLSVRAIEVLAWQFDWLRAGTPEPPSAALRELRDVLMDFAHAD